jgi:hypothetical protein
MLEATEFDENIRHDGTFHIHNELCFVMFPHNRSGLAKIIQALILYHGKSKEEAIALEQQILQEHQIAEILNDTDFQKTLWWLLTMLKDRNPERDKGTFDNSIIQLEKLQSILKGDA